ncbi:MAG: hypothetical protein P4L03_05640 [Terracidiphilus sp.]|nr:hypothetical protein [Terracidiphilus sp.]
MFRPSSFGGLRPPMGSAAHISPSRALFCAAVLTLASAALPAQVFTVDTSGRGAVPSGSPVDRRFAQIVPTHVELSQLPLDAKTRIELMRALQSEQGFAMRPFPRGHKGLTLRANGPLSPAGEPYVEMITKSGTSAKPGERLVITDVKIDRSTIAFLLNGGPDFKHRLLRHIQVGAGPSMNPVVQDNEADPQGSRLTLAFIGHVPQMTPKQVKALLAPLISFDVKTPIQAFTDTLPAPLREAILGHEVWVGMNIDMVLFAKGQPRIKTREMDGQMPFEEWIYGQPPAEVDFVRINGNRVIRVEVAKMGEKPVIFTDDRVDGLMRTDGTPAAPEVSKIRVHQVGDVQRDPDRQAPAAPPSLRKPGEETQSTVDEEISRQNHDAKNVGVMRPVQPAKPHKDDTQPAISQPAPTTQPAPKRLGANPDEEQPAAPPAPAAGSQSSQSVSK